MALWLLAGRKETTPNQEVVRVIVGRAANAPDNHRLHVVVVMCASGVTVLQRVIDRAA
jgi:hypothetical protein